MKLVRENINDYLPAPSEDDILKRLSKLSPEDELEKSLKEDFEKGIHHALERLKNLDPDRELKGAIKANSIESAKHALERGAKLSNFKLGFDPLLDALNAGKKEVVKYLIDHQDVKVAYRMHLLLTAVRKGYLSVVKSLIEIGADYRYISYEPLSTAVIAGHLDIVRYFFEEVLSEDDFRESDHPMDKSILDEKDRLFRIAREEGHKDILKYLKNKLGE